MFVCQHPLKRRVKVFCSDVADRAGDRMGQSDTVSVKQQPVAVEMLPEENIVAGFSVT